MTHIVHLNVDPEHNQYETLLLKVATKTLTLAQAPSAELSIALVDEQRIHDLNREFRNQDDPTDVLAFQGENIDPETGLAYLGDVIIAVSFARAQAKSAGHSTEAELSLLVIHGILHLLGSFSRQQRRGQPCNLWSSRMPFHVHEDSFLSLVAFPCVEVSMARFPLLVRKLPRV